MELNDDDTGEFGGKDDVEVEMEERSVLATTSSSVIDSKLSKFAKKMPIFEPMRVDGSSLVEKPLAVNLDLALYRAKVLARNFRYKEAEEVLQKVFYFRYCYFVIID